VKVLLVFYVIVPPPLPLDITEDEGVVEFKIGVFNYRRGLV